MPSKLPTVTVQLSTGPREVAFGVGRLVQVETALGKTANAILLDDLAALAPPFEPDQDKNSDVGGAGGGDAKAAEHYQAAARKIGAGFMAKFVAGCLDMTVAQIDVALGPADLRPAFIVLASGFIEAVGLLNGAEEPPEADPPKPAAAG